MVKLSLAFFKAELTSTFFSNNAGGTKITFDTSHHDTNLWQQTTQQRSITVPFPQARPEPFTPALGA
jgi:hypothetical protein